MNNDLDTILRTLERERGIGREAMLATIVNALQSAAKKSLLTAGDVRVEIDRATLQIKAWERRIVSDDVKGTDYISAADARRLAVRKLAEEGADESEDRWVPLTGPGADPADAALVPGDTVEVPVDPRVFGRIAAQTAKQAIIQGIHDSERDIMEKRYRDQVGKIVTATVRQASHKDILCDIAGGGEAILKGRDRLKSDRLQPMDEFRAVIRHVGMEQDPRRMDDGEPDDGTAVYAGRRRLKFVDEPASNPCVKLSRTDKSFIRALFLEQSSEMKDGTVDIVGIARQPGIRTKVAVRSSDPKVDPVGACVGVKGTRIRPIINELHGEKIDIVEWNDDVERFAFSALAPAAVKRIDVDREAHLVTAYVDSGALTPAIGKGGVNTPLAAELIGYAITVKELNPNGETDEERAAKAARFREEFEAKIAALAETLGVAPETAYAAAARGFLTVEGIISSTRDEFIAALGKPEEAEDGSQIPSLDPAAAQALWDTAEELVLRRAGSVQNTEPEGTAPQDGAAL